MSVDTEGLFPTEIFAKFLQHLLGLEEKSILHHAHSRPQTDEPPCLVIIRVSSLHVSNPILRKAGEVSTRAEEYKISPPLERRGQETDCLC